MRKKLLALSSILFSAAYVSAQTRYLDEVFSNITITKDVVYSTNKIYWPPPGSSLPPTGDLTMDVYQPSGDTASKRPVVVILHPGSFLPQPTNSSVTGSRKDSVIVETARRLARRGFVAAAISYRVGWNPFGNEDERTSTLLKAVYRGLQDSKNAVRFFKKDAHTSNTFKIDPCRVSLIGYGSGGYLTLAYATLDKYEEITLEKFIDGGTALPYVDTNIMGNFDGLGGNPDYVLPNWPEYDSDVSMIINCGGALGDSSWLEPGNVPMVCFHVPGDPFAPYKYGTVIVPTTGGTVVDVSGSYDVSRRNNNPTYGNNNGVFQSPAFTDIYTQRANVYNNGYEGLFPFNTIPANQASPWDWWDNATAVSLWTQPTVTNALVNNPDMSKTKAMAYIDTIFGYAIPRLVRVNNLVNCITSINEPSAVESSIFPNPAFGTVTAQTSNNSIINEILLIDSRGRLVNKTVGIKASSYSLDISNFASGLYVVHVNTNKGNSIQKLLIE